MQDASKKVSIVIVNWNAGVLLRDAMLSICEHHEGAVHKVVVVDNNSSDNSLALFEEAATGQPFQIEIVRNALNKGFGAACNQGARLVDSEFILFFNPDARLYAGSLSTPLRYLAAPENAAVGVCGAQLIDEYGHVARTCARFPSAAGYAAQAVGLNRLPWFRSMDLHMGDWDHLDTRRVDHVIGAFYLMRTAVFRTLKGFDERFFVYLEDLDLSYRTRAAGWEIVYLADAKAFHAGGGTSRQILATRLFYSLRSRLQYGFKHFSRPAAWLLVGTTMLVEPLTRSIFSMALGGWGDLKNTLKGYRMLCRSLPAVCRGRPR
jgi:GT2 family glycosyltransferase